MQKKPILLAVTSLCYLLSFAQFKKGTVSPNFNIGDLNSISINNNSSLKNIQLSFNPGIGYFIRDNWEIGVGMNYSRINYESKPAGLHSTKGYTIGINGYSNYYIGKKKLKPYFTFQTGWNYSEGIGTFNGAQNNYSGNAFYAAIGGGINWKINSKFSLFTEATYWKSKPFNRYDGYSRLNLTIGARFYFNQKKKK
jgi:hypothetical protein